LASHVAVIAASRADRAAYATRNSRGILTGFFLESLTSGCRPRVVQLGMICRSIRWRMPRWSYRNHLDQSPKIYCPKHLRGVPIAVSRPRRSSP
jgi:hypothetical protein